MDDPMDVTVTGETLADAKIKREKPDEVENIDDPTDATRSVKTEHAPIKIEADMGPTKIKSEKKDEVMDLEERMKSEAIKSEGGNVKNEHHVKTERGHDGTVKGETVKGETVKGEAVKGEQGVKGEVKGEKVKNEIKRERDRSRSGKRKKDKKDGKKIKKERKEGDRDRSRSARKKDKKDKKDKAGDGRRKRQSKWGPEIGAVGFASMTAIPAGRSGLVNLPTMEDQMPRFNDSELLERTVVLENIKGHVTGQELIEFFNGAVLAVTANAVQQAANRSMAPVFACTVTETEEGGDVKRSADLKFRTPDGAMVGMKLNGIEYKGGKLVIRRPDKFDVPDAGDPSVGISLHEMSMARLVGSNQTSGMHALKAGGEALPSPKLSIFNLPDVMSEDIVRSLLQQFGRLRMLSLIRDLATGKIKGYGIFEYDDPRDVDLAIQALNGFVCGQNVIRVQKLGGPAPGAGGEPAKPQPVAATAMANSMTQKIVSNPVLAMQVKQGREVGSRPSTVVQLLNAVYQEDLMDDQDYEDIMSEVHSEASKHGAVSRVVIPKPAKDGAFVDGVGKIFVSFQDITSARRFQMDSNGRKFENRVVCAAFYPSDKFSEGKFKLWST